MDTNPSNRKAKALKRVVDTKHPVPTPLSGGSGAGTTKPRYPVSPQDCTCKRVVLHHNGRDDPPTDAEAVKCPRCGSIIVQIIV